MKPTAAPLLRTPGVVVAFQNGFVWLRVGQQSVPLTDAECRTLASALLIGAGLIADVSPEHSC